MFSNKMLRFFTTLVVFLVSFELVSAQELNREDPLNKPALWKKLSNTPSDNALWAEYFGKSFSEMATQEKAQMNILKQKLLLNKLSGGSDLAETANNGTVSGTATASTVKMDKLSHSELANAEAIIMQEQEEVASLKQNINENFTILEDMYRDMFADYGLKFVPYKDASPDGKTPKLKWVEEQEKQIRTVKAQMLSDLKAKVNK